jgi:hypothetical protein
MRFAARPVGAQSNKRTPLAASGNQSPRKAAKKGKGREKVIAWLKMLENHSARQGREDPVGSYDFTWIWKELGLGDERR